MRYILSLGRLAFTALVLFCVGCDGALDSSAQSSLRGDDSVKINFIDSSLADLSAINYADVDQDGDVDIVAASIKGDIYWYQNNHDEGFEESLVATDLYKSYDIDIVDFNQDGHLDIVTFDADTNIVLLKGAWVTSGDELFEKVVIKAAGIGCFLFCELEVADFNNDSILDILYCGGNDCLLMTFTDMDGNAYNEYDLGGVSYPTNLHAADINGDGWIDFTYTAFSMQRIQIVMNSGKDNKFNQGYFWVDHAYGAAAIQDVNQDGVVDVVGTPLIHLGVNFDDYLRVDSSKVDYDALRFGYPRDTKVVPVNYSASSFLVADLDLDGDNDIVSTNNSGAYYFFENGDGSGEDSRLNFSFDPRGAKGLLKVPRTDGLSPSRPIRIVDVDGDGSLDIIVNQLVAGQIMWANIHALANNPYVLED